MLALALIVTLVPGYGQPSKVEAAGNYFNFPNEKDAKGSARIVSDKFVTLTGSIRNIARNSISYKVEQVSVADDKVLNQTESISTGIMTTGDSSITINNIELFPGINRITFTGISGASTIEESIYIEYRDSPMLNDLEIVFNNQRYTVAETGPTVVYSTSANTSASTGTIVLTGEAPNATRITVGINGNEFDFNVTSSNNRFTTSSLTINTGINNVTFKVVNGGQVIETSRQIVFYNGNVIHYDQMLNYGTDSIALRNGSEYSVAMTDGALAAPKLKGIAVMPLPLNDVANNGTTAINITDNTAIRDVLSRNIKLNLKTPGSPDANFTAINSTGDLSYEFSLGATNTTGYIIVNYAFQLNDLAADKVYTYTTTAPNLAQENIASPISFTLRDGSKSYIAAINYLSGFDSTMTELVSSSDPALEPTMATAINPARILALQGSQITSAGADVFSMPMGVELLIGNYSPADENISASDIKVLNKSVSTAAEAGFQLVVDSNNKAVTQVTERTINGIEGTYLRVFLQFDKLAKSGSNQLSFKLGHNNAIAEEKLALFKLAFGPFVKFDNIVNSMSVEYDSEANGANQALMNRLGQFKGQLMNVVTTSDIVYYADANAENSTKKQTVFLYLNSVEIPLKKMGNTYQFGYELPQLDNENTTDYEIRQLEYVMNVLNKAGENTLKFVYRSTNNSYESTIKFSVVPKNLPQVPAEGSDGVYPYRVGQWPPLSNDPNFTNNGSVYTTKEAQFNVYGTFDFIDLGHNRADIQSKLSAISRENYVVTISNPNWTDEIEWNLNNEFTLTEKNRSIIMEGNSPAVINTAQLPNNPDAAVTFYYDVDSEQFFFNIVNQEMPEDGSPLAYVITVYNAGKAGPRATYRLEVNPLSIPYSIKSPVLEERVINKNFVEVIISAPGADSIVINKEVAEKVSFIEYNGGDEATVNSFRAVVKDLKANKDTKISFTITRGDTKLTESFNVKYVPTNIPGAQHLETMKNSHKAFNNTLSLTFPKNTSLIRSNYNDSIDHATQVYSGHDLFFAIANPTDGIVDRHLFESQPANYSAENQQIGNVYIDYRFQDEANRFIKASPLYWIDGGLADDPDTGGYDPIKAGLDPYPFPNLVGKHTESFDLRWNKYERELIPSNAGTLTLNYDSNIVASAGTTVAVFRLDPVTMAWENIGGVVDTKKGTISVPFTKFGYYVVVKLTRSFNDIIDHSYARDAMEAIFAKGIMNAVDSVGIFGGDRYITRGEFTRMIVKALELPLNYHGELHFTYYPETVTNANNPRALYDYRYIETAARAGIVNGTRPGFFDEDVQMSREQAATMLARALELKLETDSNKAKAQLDKAFKDGVARFDNYAIPSVLAIQKKGFIVGKPMDTSDPKAGYMYDPKARMLRSDAAIIMARVMNDMKKLPKIYN